MANSDIDGQGVLVPVAASPTLEETIRHAVQIATEQDGDVHLVHVVTERSAVTEPVDSKLLQRATEMVAQETGAVSVHTSVLGVGRYIAGPTEHVLLILEYAERYGTGRVILDPSYSADATDPTLQPVESVFSDIDLAYEVTPVRSKRWSLTRGEVLRGTLIGGGMFGFYLALGGVSAFAVGSGLIVSAITAILLRNVVFENTPEFGPAARASARSIVFLPTLFWEILKANITLAYIILHPQLPIEPRFDRVEAAVSDGLSVAVLANSITLTPGTLTVDAYGHSLLVHSLDANYREGLLEGTQERAVRHLFYGSTREEVPDPATRDAVEPVLDPAQCQSGSELADPSTGGRDD